MGANTGYSSHSNKEPVPHGSVLKKYFLLCIGRWPTLGESLKSGISRCNGQVFVFCGTVQATKYN